MPQIQHFGVLEFRPAVSREQIERCFAELCGLVGKVPGLRGICHGPYDSPEGHNDGFTHGFIMSFDSPAARDAYLPHPEHERVKEILLPCLARAIVFDFAVSEQQTAEDVALRGQC